MKTIILAAIIALSAFGAKYIHEYKTKYRIYSMSCPKGMHQEIYVKLGSTSRPIERCVKNKKRKK